MDYNKELSQLTQRGLLMERLDHCTIKPDDDLSEELANDILLRIDEVQEDLEFIQDWTRRHLEDANAANSVMASYARGDTLWALNHLQGVYQFLYKVINNAENEED